MLTAIGLGWTLDVSYATQVFNYDSIGNIESKTGVGNGNYAYPSSGATSFGTYGASNNRPHAVQSIPGIGSFTYDDNGNLKNGAGRSIDWTSFDMPSSITKGNESSSFAYGADHQRTKQMKSDGGANTSTIYYAGAMEVETKSGTVQSIKTYWPGGIGFEIDKPTQATELNWIHTDRLGSVIAISNASGTLVERLAYDSWGKRRSLSGNETPDSIDGVKDNKGFTGHEMLDKLDLVHMNGRIYDPLIARFMSADPIIQDPEHSQSYNRYTYVWNNPTNLTDPTGFVAAAKPSSIAVQNCAQSAGCQVGEDGSINYVDSYEMVESFGGNETGNVNSTSVDNTGLTKTNAAEGRAKSAIKNTKWPAHEKASAQLLKDAGYTVMEKVRLTWEGAKGSYAVLDVVATKMINGEMHIVLVEAKDGISAKLSSGQKAVFEAAFKSKQIFIEYAKDAVRLNLEAGKSLLQQGTLLTVVDASVPGARASMEGGRIAARARMGGFVNPSVLFGGFARMAPGFAVAEILTHIQGTGNCDNSGKCQDMPDWDKIEKEKVKREQLNR